MKSNIKKANQVIKNSIILNVLLAGFKIFSGIVGHSSAMIADGIHTLSDIVSSLVVFIGLKISSKKADADHPYGHDRFELIFSKILSGLLFITGFFIASEAVKNLKSGNYSQPGTIALLAAIISIIIKEVMFRFTIKAAKEIESLSLEADAWHHRSDVYSSIATFLGILGAKLGLYILDPILAFIVALLIIKVAIEIYLESISGLVDEAADPKMVKNIEKCINKSDKIKSYSNLKTRKFGNKVFIDLNISVDGDISVREGHDIAKELHDRIEKNYPKVKHIMVHVEPYDE